uniref:Uncharacterized protein n=1 Tax=Rhizophora mucronata TaxID=61149 RepID=A0A2P2MU39_RHIMU
MDETGKRDLNFFSVVSLPQGNSITLNYAVSPFEAFSWSFVCKSLIETTCTLSKLDEFYVSVVWEEEKKLAYDVK